MEREWTATEESQPLVSDHHPLTHHGAPQDGPQHQADPGVHEERGHQHPPGGRGSGNGASDAGLSDGREGTTTFYH